MRTTTFLDPSRRVPGTKRRDAVRGRRGGAALDAAESFAGELARGAAAGTWGSCPKLDIGEYICDARSVAYDRATDTLTLRFADDDFCDGPSEVTISEFSRVVSENRRVAVMVERGNVWDGPREFKLYKGYAVDPELVRLNGTPVREHPDNGDAEYVRLMLVQASAG